MSTFFVRFIALYVRFGTFLKKVSIFSVILPLFLSVHRIIEQMSFNAEWFTLHICNDRFWSKSQGVRNNFFASNWKQSMTKMHVRHYCRTCGVISCYEKSCVFRCLENNFYGCSFSDFAIKCYLAAVVNQHLHIIHFYIPQFLSVCVHLHYATFQ